jgi:Sigma-70 region 2
VAHTQGFEEFYTATVGRLLGQLFPVTGDLHEAEEIVQEAFARASTRWARLRDYDAPEAWVRRVAMNLAADRGRRLQRQARALLRAGPPASVPAVSVEALALAEALRTLPCTSGRRSCSTTWSTCPSRRSRRSWGPAAARSRAGWPGAAAPWRPGSATPRRCCPDTSHVNLMRL